MTKSASQPENFQLQVPVLIAGGGPIGLTLGHTLSSYGIPFMLVERNDSTTRHPKMDITSSRSMELFSKIGVAQKMREAGVSPDHPRDVLYVTGLGPNSRELLRFKYGSANESWEKIRSSQDGSLPAQPPLRLSQAVLEPVLKEALENLPGADVRFGWAFDSFTQDSTGVTATIKEMATGKTEQVRCSYLAGCDGGNSAVRQGLGIDLEGTSGLRPSYLVHFKSKTLDALQRWGIAWHQRAGRVGIIAQNDRDTWTVQYRLNPGETPPADPHTVLNFAFGRDIGAEIIVANPYQTHLLIADSFGEGRVLLAGDAAHQFVPTGGYGMNTGVGDAVGLGWALAAVLQGWGGPQLLEAYKTERRAIALRNREGSRTHFETRQHIRGLFEASGDLDEETPEGEVRRNALTSELRAIGNRENESAGIEHGYAYYDSPVIWQEAGEPPVLDPFVYRPSTWPGSRLPSVALQDRSTVYEKLGAGFNLLVLGDQSTQSIKDFESAAAQFNLPVTVVRLPSEVHAVYQRSLLLVRPDHHVAWRGDSAPSNWPDVLAHVTGKAASATASNQEAAVGSSA